MPSTYYEHVRSEIAPLLPPAPKRIVDVGCGTGATLVWLRERYPSAYTIGLEGNANVRPELERNADEAHIVDLSGDTLPAIGAPDLMLFLDVLEHLPDSAALLAKLASQLAPDGVIIVSLPNVAHLSVSLPLLLKGEFTYRDAGILDRTHLRFFTRASAVALVTDAGFIVDRALEAGIEGPKSRFLDQITFGRLRSRLSKQFIMRGVARGSRRVHPPINWDLAPRGGRQFVPGGGRPGSEACQPQP